MGTAEDFAAITKPHPSNLLAHLIPLSNLIRQSLFRPKLSGWAITGQFPAKLETKHGFLSTMFGNCPDLCRNPQPRPGNRPHEVFPDLHFPPRLGPTPFPALSSKKFAPKTKTS